MFSAFKSLIDNAQKALEEITTEIQKPDLRVPQSPDLLDDLKKTSADFSETISPAIDNLKKTVGFSDTISPTLVVQQIGREKIGLPFFGSENTTQLETWMYRENFSAGSGMLTKYTLYLNKIGQNNRTLSQKSNSCGQALCTTVIEAAKSQHEWRQVQSIISELPNINLQLNLLQKKVEAIVFKIEDIEKKFENDLNFTVSCQISLWKVNKENEVLEQHEKYKKDLVVLEQRFTKIAKELEVEDKKKESKTRKRRKRKPKK